MIQLRPYQTEGLDAIWEYFQSGKTGNPVIAWPTGTGKSVVPAVFIEGVMRIWPTQRFLMVTHVSELIKQNAEVLKLVWPTAPLGIYSAGLKQKDAGFPIVYGGIQSMIKNPAMFGHRDIAFVDEAHLVSPEDDSNYQDFFKIAKLINPNLKIIGMSATPFRMGQGYITDGGLFTDIVHDLTGVDEFNRLIAQGFLCPLIPLRTKTELDVSNVGMNKGDFVVSQLQSAVDKAEITFNALRELVEAGRNRKSWLIFASGIEHAEHIAEMLSTFSIQCAAVHSKQTSEYNDAAIKAFKAGELRAISNYGKLTTGFNYEDIDLIGMLRPTMSVPLWVQMLGRGTRPAKGKENCLVLDFARNTVRLGPINEPAIPRKKGDKPGIMPVKLCEDCGAYNHAKVRFCVQCGKEFDFAIKLVASSGKEELLRSDLPVVESYDVVKAIYAKRQKKDMVTGLQGKPYIKVTYFCGMQSFTQNVFPEHGRYATKLFHDWWRQRHPTEPPQTTDEALQYISQLRTPRSIRVWVNRKYPEIVSTEY